jgi:hypothetical protein
MRLKKDKAAREKKKKLQPATTAAGDITDITAGS